MLVRTMIGGKWKNTLGSVMEVIPGIECDKFMGTYTTGVGNARKTHSMLGQFQYKEYQGRPCLLMTWSVQWTDPMDATKPPSCTTWSAQGVFDDIMNVCALDSTYVLRRYTDAFERWDQPIVNKDMFIRLEEDRFTCPEEDSEDE